MANETPKTLSNVYAFLVINLTVLPGVGSIMGGKKAEGWMQILLSLVGTFLTIFWLASWVIRMLKERAIILEANGMLAMGLVGVAMFMIGWVWSFFTAWKIIQDTKANQ